MYLHPQWVTEGAETWQAAGRLNALVTFRVIPNWALFLNPSHKHSASVFNVVLRPEQHDPSGFSTVLPLVTNDKQSAIVNVKLEQSTAGAAAPAPEEDADSTTLLFEIIKITPNTTTSLINLFFIIIFFISLFVLTILRQIVKKIMVWSMGNLRLWLSRESYVYAYNFVKSKSINKVLLDENGSNFFILY